MSGATIEQFLGELTQWQEQVREKADLLPQAVAQTVFNEVSSGGKYGPGTPVDTGFARSSWDGGVGAIPNNPAAGSPEEAEARTLAAIATAKAGDTIYLSNNAPYIGVLEYGGYPQPVKRGTRNKQASGFTQFEIKSVGGYSYQAPRGMVRVVLAQAQAVVDEVGAFLAGRLRRLRVTGQL